MQLNICVGKKKKLYGMNGVVKAKLIDNKL